MPRTLKRCAALPLAKAVAGGIASRPDSGLVIVSENQITTLSGAIAAELTTTKTAVKTMANLAIASMNHDR